MRGPFARSKNARAGNTCASGDLINGCLAVEMTPPNETDEVHIALLRAIDSSQPERLVHDCQHDANRAS
jgi:hypothetical protein